MPRKLSKTQNRAPRIIPRWPDYFNPYGGEKVARDLIGATIVKIGTSKQRIEGGGLLIEYTPRRKHKSVRLTLAFNELGMWPDSQSVAQSVIARQHGMP